ncbi:hypothetical protein FD48_GL002446 [Lactiplantibacillus paraplantarum DSM 10667]|nr:hypothetical protein FD48_GL002446 [Lactiplantibacillus paraplantarum DSM 10667]
MEDQYLRRGVRLKSVSIAFQQLAEMPSAGLSWLFLTLTIWHVLIMIYPQQ